MTSEIEIAIGALVAAATQVLKIAPLRDDAHTRAIAAKPGTRSIVIVDGAAIFPSVSIELLSLTEDAAERTEVFRFGAPVIFLPISEK